MAAHVLTRRQQAKASKERLLEAGIEQFSQRPFEQVSVASIAKSAGLAHGLLFHHFGSKRGLYLAVLEETTRRRQERFDNIEHDEPAATVRALLEAHLSAVRSNPAVLRALLRGEVGVDPAATAILDDDRLGAIRRLCLELGLDSKNTAVVVSLRAWTGAVDEAAVASLDDAGRVPVAQLAEALLRLLHTSLSNLALLDPTVDLTMALTVVEQWHPR